MPNINITDSRKRDAVVKAESTRISEPVRYVDDNGERAYSRKVLKATVDHDYDSMLARFETPEAVGQALIDGDPEVDIEIFGSFLWNVSRVYIDPEGEIVFRIEQHEVMRDPQGEITGERPRRRLEANVDDDIPLTWTGTIIPKADAYRRYVFSSKLQIVHVNGLTYDFLYGISKELEAQKGLMLVGGGKSGKEPLVFRRGSVAYRGFLEGRTDGDRYILLLHLSNQELRAPKPGENAQETAPAVESSDKPAKKATTKAGKKSAAKPAKKSAKKPAKKPAKKSATKSARKPAKKKAAKKATKKATKKKTTKAGTKKTAKKSRK